MGAGHAHGSVEVREHQRRVLLVVLAVNAVLLVGEVIGGLVFDSLALLADAAHQLSDVVGLGIALVAHSLMSRPASSRLSFGLLRAEVVGAQANGVVLVATAGWILVEAVRRFDDPPDVAGAGVVAVAVVGLAVNVVSAAVLARARGTSLNVRAAYIHMTADAAGSFGAIVAGVAVLAGVDRADPAISALIALLVLWAAWRLLREATHVLLEGAPAGLDAEEIERTLSADEAVDGVHHLHVWSLASDTPSLSGHVILRGPLTLHEAQAEGDRLRALLTERFGIAHATLELECHECLVEGEPATHE